MNVFSWLAGFITRRGRATSLYQSGLAKARKRDYHGAIADYSQAIDAPNAPVDVKGMATYNRALAYAAIQEVKKAADDLAAMLNMPGLPEKVVTEARQRRERIRRRLQNKESAL